MSLLTGLPARAQAPAGRAGSVSARVYADKAQNHFYNGEFKPAEELYRKALELEPENPDHWTALAHVYLFQQLEYLGRLDEQVYTASNAFVDLGPKEMEPKLLREMWDALGHARNICEQRLRANPRDAEAHYFLGLAYAIEGSFHFNAARKPLDTLRPANKAREHHQRVREMDPNNHDANLVIGTYEYAVASVPAPIRWLLYLGGHSGSKERGVRFILDALMNGTRGPAPALVMLAYIYRREGQHGHSRQMIEHLHRFYPRSPIYEMEIGWSYVLEKQLAAALETYRNVARKMEARAPGYDRANAPRLYFQIAAVFERQEKFAEAAEYCQRVLSSSDAARRDTDGADMWSSLRAYTLLKLGDLYIHLEQVPKAREMYQRAAGSSHALVVRSAMQKLRALDSRAR